MTQEEWQRLQADALRKAQEKSTMLSQSAMTPEVLAALAQQAGYDPAGREAMLATMLRGGQDALYGDLPQGKEVGGIYVAPTWSESLNAAAQKMIGGYQMGQARKEQAGIDTKRAAAETAKAQVAAEAVRAKEQAAADKEVTTILNAQGEAADRQAVMDQRDRLANSAEQGRNARAMLPRATATGRAPTYARQSFIDPNDPSKPINVFVGNDGSAKDSAGNPVDISGLTPWSQPKAPTKPTGSYGATQEERKNFATKGQFALATRDLLNSYKPEYSSNLAVRSGRMGGLANTVERTLGVNSDATSWWATKDKAELQPRHENFGSAFTAPEQKLYEETTFSKNDSPEFIQGQLKKRYELERTGAERIAADYLLKGAPVEEVQLKYGDVVDIPALQAGLQDGSYMERRKAEQEAARQEFEAKYKKAPSDDLHSKSLEELRRLAAE